ncbi:MAG TPA: DUF952 domain-containing protein [Pedococcus sp.]
MSIYHLAEPEHWAAVSSGGSYTRSTRGRTVEQEGFVHCSTDEQWPVVRRKFYADVDGPLVLLEIDESRLPQAPVWEVGDPATGERFPHLYHPLPAGAVVAATELAPPHG